ncbi:hypothetical protein GCM10008022_03930 [Paenibacillus hunanensis]|uniref:Uncharacterized protein n=1 Tax=Paenibacillus hunanensis TaxID=539262 RepID=A0ABU1IWH1_9BACL|nr:hypothetical protein [Paenibacillus hunanensis]GGI98392.1 hypothetical protein GCM10008022_03930 [Paenibacillus hunanensis]
MKDVESYVITFLIIAAVLIILFHILSLILFFRLLRRPHLRIKTIDALTPFKKTESLFHSYKLMPEHNRKMIKLWL